MSTIERWLEEQHGDLHKVIPRLASEVGQEEAARRLKVRQAWLSIWLARHGYVRVTSYEREGDKSS